MEVLLSIDGRACEGEAGWLPIIDPATENPVGRVALASAADVDAAVAAADRAFADWARLPAHERGAIIKRAAELLAERSESVARTLSLEGGKTTPEAHAELARAVETLAWNGEEAGRVEGRLLPGKTPGGQRLAIPTPLGVVAAFTAWNFPAVLATRKLGAILAAGCTAVLKAAESTPSTAAAVVNCLVDAGAPNGIVNLVYGDPAPLAEQLISAPAVRAVTFTGSTRVGRIIAGHAARGLKHCVLELGGHAPVIVAQDGDVDLAIRTTLPAKFGSAGQSCVAPSRYYVHVSQHETFLERLVDAARALRCGAFTEPGAEVGPVIDAGRIAALEQLTADALNRGARLLCGGERLARDGWFWAPTVLADVPSDALIMSEEPFGPIAVVNRFDKLGDALETANATPYAFAAYVFTDSQRTRAKVLRTLHASNIGINQAAPSLPDAPLGGMDDSGMGYEGGRDGIAAFQHLRLVSDACAV
jgi:succinate-semialdehyde dehydrogenase/glutarate-semialdehyde dehydrogenase